MAPISGEAAIVAAMRDDTRKAALFSCYVGRSAFGPLAAKPSPKPLDAGTGCLN
jgi:hypothetical protein